MANNFYGATSLSGGGTGALDAINGNLLNDGDGCVVITATLTYFYKLDATSGAAESSPGIISPDNNAGTKRWILKATYSDVSAAANIAAGAIVVGDDGVKGVKGSPVATLSDAGALAGIISIAGLTTPLSKAQGGSGTTGDSIIKGWIQFNGSGVIAISDSFNVTSITDNGTGDYTVTWDVDFANNAYAATGACHNWFTYGPCGQTVGTVNIFTYDTNKAAADSTEISIIATGDQ